MGRPETLAAVREKYPQYKDMSDDALASGLAAKYPEYSDLVTKSDAASAPEGPLSHVGRIVREEAGKVPGRVAEDVSGLVEGIKNPKMSTVLPLTLGPAAGVVPRLGALAGGRIVDDPKPTLGENLATAGKAAAGGLLTEGAAKALPKVKIPFVGKLADLAEEAARNPKAAFDSIAARLPNARVLVPSLDPAKKLTFPEIGDRIAKLTGDARKQAIDEMRHILDGLDRQLLAGGPPPGAGTLFAERAGKAPVTRLQQFAKDVAVPATKDPLARLGADVAGTEEPGGRGIPAAFMPLLYLLDKGQDLSGLAKHLIMRR